VDEGQACGRGLFRLWSVEDLVALWEAYEQRRAERAAMTVKELLERLSMLPDHDAEVLVQVPDPNDPEAPDDYSIEDVTFMDWPTHYRSSGDVSGVAELSRPQAYIKV
jgi:hypothetical protein